MQLSQAFHGACEAESALKAPSRGQEQQCATFVQAIVFIFPCDWWCVGTLRAVHKTGRLSATFCAVATRTPCNNPISSSLSNGMEQFLHYEAAVVPDRVEVWV